MSKTPVPNETFINLILAACEDAQMRAQIAGILILPQNARLSVLSMFLQKMRQQGAPADFIEAIAFLKNPGVAEKVLALISEKK